MEVRQTFTSLALKSVKDPIEDSFLAKVRESLVQKFGTAIYRDWFQQLTLASIDEGVVACSVPTIFVKDWISQHYLDALAQLCRQEIPGCVGVKLNVGEDPSFQMNTQQTAPSSLIVQDRFASEDDIPSMSLDPRFTFDKFVVGKPNEFAYAAACRVAETRDAVYNPLFLYGPVGHGKTHLMHSMAHVMMRQSQGQVKILYLSAEKFMYYFIRALRYKTILSFKERLRSVDVLMVDDVQFICGKESTQEEFFHTFNALVDMRKQVIISADQSPADLNGIQERMKSRLGCGLVADLHPTTYELRVGILQSKALAHGIDLPEEITDFLASHMTASVRELEGALTRVVAHSALVGRPLTVDLVRILLKDSLRPQGRDLTIDDIQKKVAAYFRIKISDLTSSKRARSVVRPRQIAMYLAKSLTTVSLPAIGRHFGGRDHTTVMHSVATITELIQRDIALREDVTLLRQSLENR